MKRQLVLDTETTGLDPKAGHRIIEIGCIELIDRCPTGNNWHYYINPARQIDDEAIAVHGITNEFLKDKPLFHQLVDELMQYLSGAELIIHNAGFDVSFLNHELSLLPSNRWGLLTDHCPILDTLEMARKLHPGQRNSLDALCKRYNVNNAHRELHGGLLDAGILADVYLAMTGGQLSMLLADEDNHNDTTTQHTSYTPLNRTDLQLIVVNASAAELEAHQAFCGKFKK